MKRKLLILLTLVLVGTFTACGKEEVPETENKTTQNVEDLMSKEFNVEFETMEDFLPEDTKVVANIDGVIIEKDADYGDVYNALLEKGWYMMYYEYTDAKEGDIIVEKGYDNIIALGHDDLPYSLDLPVYNGKDEEADLFDCTIKSVYYSVLEYEMASDIEGLDINGIEPGMTLEEMVSRLGRPSLVMYFDDGAQYDYMIDPWNLVLRINVKDEFGVLNVVSNLY